MKKVFKVFLLVAFSLFMLFISFNRHSKYKTFNYRNEIFADRAGYYVYLPALFNYGFKADSFPKNIDSKTGNGFRLDSISNKVVTKYTYGVALLQTPFFLLAHGTSLMTVSETDGFSFLYQKSIDVAAIFYLVLGLLALFKLLNKKFSPVVSFITVATILAGTNLFYYSVIDTGMSHVYSFSMFAIYLYTLAMHNQFKNKQIKYGLLLGVLVGIIVMLRPLNLLFVMSSFALFPAIFSWQFLKQHTKLVVIFLIAGFVMIIPQLFYWYYLSESPIYYSYAGESFTNIFSPKISEVLFAPNNGHILYNPIFLVCLFGVIWMIIDQQRYGWVTAALLVVIVYVISSWWIYSFGCGFANRNFVEYYSLLALPLAYLINKPKQKSIQSGLYILILLFVIYNIKMSISFDGCWYGKGDWDWSMYIHWLLNSPS